LTDPASSRRGVLLALAAFGFWGLVPVYFKAVRQVPPLEILAHRIVWSVPLTAGLIALRRDWSALRRALVDRGTAGTLAVSACLVAVNWLVFIYAVTHDRVVEASLGYFINPLVNVVLGMLILRERLRRPQVAAVLLALAGTVYMTASYGALPWIALTLATSFGLYGLLRKTVRIESVNGLFVETSLLAPIALAYLLLLSVDGAGSFLHAGRRVDLLLIGAGLVTTLPLVWFTAAARRLRYITIGLLQYIAPSLQLLLGVVAYDEAFTRVHWVTFGSIWAGLGIFMADSLRRSAPRHRDRGDDRS
jgi:chloramphenicol-sensitive protein RarD